MSGNLTTDCRYCTSPMNERARVCLACKSYRSWWKNWLTYYGSIAGGLAIVVSALVYIPSQAVNLRKAFGGQDKFEMVHFEYPGDLSFFNSGDNPIVIQSVMVAWPGTGIARTLTLPIDLAIRPGEVQYAHISSLYKEPATIDGAEWVFGEATDAQVGDAFAIGDVNRCSVFHMFDLHNPSLQAIQATHPERPVAYLPAEVTVNLLHMKTDLWGRTAETSSSDRNAAFRTAFLTKVGCQTEDPPPRRAETAAR